MLQDEYKELEDNSAIKCIADYLLKRAETDPTVKTSIEKENKSIKECMSFIMSEVKRKTTGSCACVSDEEVFGLAVHYYDEDDLDVKPLKGSVAKVKTSQKPIVKKDFGGDAAKEELNKKIKKQKKTIEQLRAENKSLKKTSKHIKPKKVKKDEQADGQLSLFGIL